MGRIQVPTQDQPTMRTSVYTHRQPFRHHSSTPGTFLGGAPRIHLHHSGASVFRFAPKNGQEQRPRGVMETFREPRQRSPAHHARSQPFHRNEPVRFDDPPRRLVKRVPSLINDFQMVLLQKQDQFASSMGPFLAPRNAALRRSQFCASPLGVPRILNRRTVAQHRQRGQPQVQAHLVRTSNDGGWDLVAGDAEKPPVRLTPNGHDPHTPSDGRLGNEAEVGAQFGQGDMVGLDAHRTVPRLPVGEAVIAGCGSESRIPGCFTASAASEKRLVG